MVEFLMDKWYMCIYWSVFSWISWRISNEVWDNPYRDIYRYEVFEDVECRRCLVKLWKQMYGSNKYAWVTNSWEFTPNETDSELMISVVMVSSTKVQVVVYIILIHSKSCGGIPDVWMDKVPLPTLEQPKTITCGPAALSLDPKALRLEPDT